MRAKKDGTSLRVSLEEGETMEGVLTQIIKTAVKASGVDITDEEARKYICALPERGQQGRALVKQFYIESTAYPLFIKQADNLTEVVIAPACGCTSGLYREVVEITERSFLGSNVPSMDPGLAPIGFFPELRH